MNLMWYLDEFERESEEWTGQYHLVNMTGDILRDLLSIEDSETPVEYRQHNVEIDDLPKLAPYTDRPINIDPTHCYEVGLLGE